MCLRENHSRQKEQVQRPTAGMSSKRRTEARAPGAERQGKWWEMR